MVKAFNNVLGTALTKVCNVACDVWDKRIGTMLWEYRITSKKLTECTPFSLVYGKEAVMPMEFLVHSLYVILMTKMIEYRMLKKILEFHKGGKIFLYDNKFMQHLGKIHMHWLGSFQVDLIMEVGIVKLKDLQECLLKGYMNGSRLNPYSSSQTGTKS